MKEVGVVNIKKYYVSLCAFYAYIVYFLFIFSALPAYATFQNTGNTAYKTTTTTEISNEAMSPDLFFKKLRDILTFQIGFAPDFSLQQIFQNMFDDFNEKIKDITGIDTTKFSSFLEDAAHDIFDWFASALNGVLRQ